MEENTQEKNLIEKNEKGIFSKIKNFFKNLFTKKDSQMIDNEDSKENTTQQKDNNEFKDYIKMTQDEETKLLDIQARYRRGEIGQNDLTDEQIDALCNLYDKQIADLKKAIENTKKQIEQYDKKIEKKNA